MGLLSWTVGLPLAPVRGVVALGKVIQQQVDAELTQPANVRRRLEALDEEREHGEISDEEAAEREESITSALTRSERVEPRESDQ